MASKSKRRRLARERAERTNLSHADQRFILKLTERGGSPHSKHSAKAGRKHCKQVRETERYTSGFRGEAMATGKDEQGRFRVHDVPYPVTGKVWVRKGVKP